MKTWQKLVVIFVGGGISWTSAFLISVWPDYAVVLASLSTAATATVGIMTGFKPTTT